MNAPEPAVTNAPPNATAVALLPLADIVASPSNPRKHFDDAYIAELAETIKLHGVIQPITVRPLPLDAMFAYNKRRKDGDDSAPRYELVVGECRWHAAKLAGLAEIPGFWRELDDKQVLEIQVIENLQRRDVHAIEEAEGYQALMTRHGYSADRIAAKIGKSRSYVYGRLKYTALASQVRDDFFAGKLTESVALLIARIPGEALQKKAAKEVINGYNNEPLSFRAAKQHIHSRYTLSLAQATFKPDDAALLPAAGACSACPKLSGNFQDLFNDIEAADVCTDPDCFEAKRQARRAQLIANAEAKKIPVLLGDEAREKRRDENVVWLDATVEGDAEERTYREILGDKAPVTMLLERQFGNNDLMECADETTLAKALKKAGWVRTEAAPDIAPRKGETAEQAEAREAARVKANAEAEQRDADATAETLRRAEALDAAIGRLHAIPLDTDYATEKVLYLLAEAWFRNLTDSNELSELEDMIRRHIAPDYTLPEEFDEAPEVARAIGLLRAAPLTRVIGWMLADFVQSSECTVQSWYLTDDRRATAMPHILPQLTQLLDVPFQSLTHPTATPSQAAPAGGDGQTPAAPDKAKPAKKAKAKADPAPASTTNEAAAPPKTGALTAWPFPIGART